ncbi:phage integrase N-terminal SAM-like domain-containing protein, partial [Candidatus Bipolaricaulota bacterium]|nr:phage integrase N-terminal SAM-like domain-containing protein [Candidatus Bipolaricaulota bacterium]
QYDYVLGRFTEKFPKDREADSIEAIEVRKYLAYLMDDGLANTSVAIHYRVLRAFFNWLVDASYLSRSPMRDINEPKNSRQISKSFGQGSSKKTS